MHKITHLGNNPYNKDYIEFQYFYHYTLQYTFWFWILFHCHKSLNIYSSYPIHLLMMQQCQ